MMALRKEPAAAGPSPGHTLSLVPEAARSVLILANPTSGSYRPARLEAICKGLTDSGHAVSLHLTKRAGEIGEIAANPGLAIGVLAVAGGDGSVNEAITGFQQNSNPPALAVIPSGTANVLAAELGLPRKAKAIADMIARRRCVPLHYGLANGRPFVLMASAGFDAEVVHAVPLSLKRRLGKLAYGLIGVEVALSRQGQDLTVEADGAILTCRLAIATKSRCYGGPFVVCREASVTEPGLHLVTLAEDNALSALRYGLALMMGRLDKAQGVKIMRAERISISAARRVPAQVDGDPFGVTPLTIEPAPLPVSIIVP
ncbi:diacylglycerol/lipid kinase family protein [Pannonibacter sp.]|uniref:diacylglycerol/lipid kinase family protein n=1 Tax=Pannonibacter sp. TaxID=1906786 RepID=UPI003F7190A6